MLIIREAQMKVLNGRFEAAFRQDVAAFLESEFSATTIALGPEGVKTLIEDGIQRASRHGFELEADICDFIAIMAEHGPDFDQQRWAADILGAGDSTSVKIARLVARAEGLRARTRKA